MFASVAAAKAPAPARHLRVTGSAAVCRSSSSVCAADVLIVDATNVLARAHADLRRGARLQGETAATCFAHWLHFLSAVAKPQLSVLVFDAPRSTRKQQQQREQLAPEYLARRKRRKSASAGTSSAAEPPKGDPLRPFKQLAQQQGSVCLEAAGGWEADDGIAAACRAVAMHHSAASVLVASGDADMQQLVTAQVSWLQLHNQPSLSCPLAAEVVGAAVFEQRYGFKPSAYADWLAFTGKKEASIAGASVGAKTAARLLGRYGSLEGVVAAAAAGELKGWGPQAARLLGVGVGSEEAAHREALLRRNRVLFRANADPAAVCPRGVQQLLAALARLQPAACSSADGDAHPAGALALDLAWQHPLHARRWHQLLQLVPDAFAGPAAGGDAALQQVVTREGLAATQLAERDGQRTASLCICPCDVSPDSWPRALAAGRLQQGRTAALLPLLNGATRHHVRLLRRTGYRVELHAAGADAD